MTAEMEQLRWRCRRGMRELDVLLERYLTQRFPHAKAAEQQAFGRLLTLEDPLLAGWLIYGHPCPDAELQSLLTSILVSAKPD